MTKQLSGRARRFAELIEHSHRRKLTLRDLWRIFDRADPASQLSLGRRKILIATLDELAEAGIITFPSMKSYDRSEQPPTPKFVLIARTAPAPVATPHIVWHPELSWAAHTPLTDSQRERLATINTWLFRERGDLLAPLRERSLEIFGDEKTLDAMMTTQVFADNRLSLTMLRARRVVPPLHTEEIGPGDTLLVVENSDTFDSTIRALTSSPGRIGFVGWGAGGGFEASVLSIPQLGRTITETVYFGDLDRAGLRIPVSADRLARSAGLPPVRPAIALYDALLKHGKAQGGQQPTPPEVVDTLTGWLAPQHRESAATLLRSGRRMAQEAIGIAYLLANDDWKPPETEAGT